MVQYEWCFETMDGEDAIDLNFGDRLHDLGEPSPADVLCLVRHHNHEGYSDDAWAYVTAGALPEWFTECGLLSDPVVAKVPRRFHRELAAWRERR